MVDRPAGERPTEPHRSDVVPEPAETVRTEIRKLLDRRNIEEVDLADDADLFDDLEMDSLELAELSAALEDELGDDPYSSGLMPRTVADLLAFYHS